MEGSILNSIDYILQSVDILYIFAILFGTEALKKYLPGYKKYFKTQNFTLLISLVMAILFIAIQGELNADYFIKLFVSFLVSIAIYDFVWKWIFEKKPDFPTYDEDDEKA